MKNVVFISPNFPTNYWMFCRELKNNGLRVLGIGDAPYDELRPELRECLTEYYRVGSLENYDEVYRAVAFLIYRHGPIDWLESNNEYWLEQDARLRTAFHITSGFQEDDMPRVRHKSLMKEFYRQAGIPCARWHLVEGIEGCRDFIARVGWPVIVKPDAGVGASHTYRLESESDLQAFFADKDERIRYIMEECVFGAICSYDAIVGSAGQVLFETGNVTPIPIMDIVNNADTARFYILDELGQDMRDAGRAVVAATGVKSRFVHFEFFHLSRDQEGLGPAGQIVGLEVNMRPSGGFSPDMMNFAHSTNVYKIWADMVAFDETAVAAGPHELCAFVGRRDGRRYALGHDEVLARYGSHLRLCERMPDALADAMGNQMYIATFPARDELEGFFRDVLTEEA